MDSSAVIGWMIGACVLFFCVVLFARPIKWLFRLSMNSLIGICALFITNYFLAPFDLAVGINAFTALTVGLLGIPGYVCVYVLRFMI